ncbi:MAG: hypothetical protein WBA57_09835 [Elainellaceae cyanobacterium]
MKLDPTLALVMALLTLMVGATTASALWGFKLGRKALGGITQPELRPNQLREAGLGSGATTASGSTPVKNESGDIVLLSEADLIANAQARISGQPVPVRPVSETVANSASADEQLESDEAAESDSDVTFVNYQNSFPFLAEDDAVLLSVSSVQEQGDSLRVSVSLQNTGDTPVEFLYSLMDVSDNRGSPLSISTNDLPQTIPPNGEEFNGTVLIPAILLDRAESISIRLANYPEQDIELAISGIPITR